ncbi:hypothetical protein [Aquimarina sediminis]|uniref:hypothetical protein n=1 Tax=Aquimarina sediminis TaxID=2070536 RepID=UPI000FFE36D0|nr:hypothetical protein [Aquimarina sediminis]
MAIKKGKIVDSLIEPSTGNYYSIYLPKTFSTNKTYPILLGFRSSEESNSIMKLTKEAAEQNEYILAVSTFSEHQEIKEKVAYISKFLEHILSLFPIQKERVYLVGVESNAKLMSILPALHSDTIAGVLAIEDTYYYNSAIKIKKNFSYQGIVNTDNYRYRDFLDNKRYLKSKAIPADVLVYEEDSEEVKKELAKKVLSTFTLQAMHKGKVLKDSLWIQNLFEHEMEQVEEYIARNKLLDAYKEIKRIRIKYGMFFSTSYLKEKQKEIKKEKNYRLEKRLQTKYQNKEIFLREMYSFSMDEDVEVLDYENLGWWKYQVSLLDTLISGKEKFARKMGHRVKGYLKYLASEYKKSTLDEKGGFEEQLYLNILCTVVDAKDFDSYLKIISLCAQDQDSETALFYLKELLKNEFKDLDALYTIEGTLALKLSKDYNKLVKQYLGKSKYLVSD